MVFRWNKGIPTFCRPFLTKSVPGARWEFSRNPQLQDLSWLQSTYSRWNGWEGSRNGLKPSSTWDFFGHVGFWWKCPRGLDGKSVGTHSLFLWIYILSQWKKNCLASDSWQWDIRTSPINGLYTHWQVIYKLVIFHCNLWFPEDDICKFVASIQYSCPEIHILSGWILYFGLVRNWFGSIPHYIYTHTLSIVKYSMSIAPMIFRQYPNYLSPFFGEVPHFLLPGALRWLTRNPGEI